MLHAAQPTVDAEQALVACAFVDGAETILTAEAAGVTDAEFLDPLCACIWARLRVMVREQKPIDELTACSEMQLAGELDRIGGFRGLTAITSRITTTAHRAYHIEVVAQQSRFRAIRRAAMGLQEAAAIGDGDQVAAALKSVSVATAPKKAIGSVADACKSARANIEEIRAGKKNPGVFGLYLPRLDSFFGRFRAGQLVCVAARPGVGKTSILIQAAVAAARDGLNVRFYGLEMSNEELVTVAAGQLSGISPNAVERNEVHAADAEDFFAALDYIGTLKTLTLIDCDRAYEEIASRTRAAALRRKVDGVFVDYLQLMRPPKGAHQATRDQQIGEMTRDAKEMARQIGAPVVIAAQLKRLGDGAENRAPTMSDLRESGNIEQDCDKVILLHRPDKDALGNIQQPDTETAHVKIIVDKNRKGRTGPTWVSFRGPTQQFTEMQSNTTQ